MRRTILIFFIVEDAAYSVFVLFLFYRGDNIELFLMHIQSEKHFLFSVQCLKAFASSPVTSTELPPQAAYPLSKWLQLSGVRHIATILVSSW